MLFRQWYVPFAVYHNILEVYSDQLLYSIHASFFTATVRAVKAESYVNILKQESQEGVF